VNVDYLIVGQGLAGSLLAWHLLELGQKILVVDRDEEETSSKVAAGLVNPLAGSRFNLPPGLEERLDYARSFYWKVEEQAGRILYHHNRIARLFRNETESTAWNRRLGEEPGRYARFFSPLGNLPPQLRLSHGGFEMRDAGWLEVPAFLEITRRHLLERLAYAVATVRSEEVEVKETSVHWKNVNASAIVFCEGWRGNRNRFFDWVPMNPAAGDILDLEIPSLAGESRIVNSGAWLIPLGGGRFRAGSTYRHETEPAGPCKSGRDEVLAKTRLFLNDEPRVTGHRCAIRPVIRRSHVFLGRHPGLTRVAFLNGLGSKGVLNGPWFARLLARHLVSGEPVPAEHDLRTNFL